MLMRFDPFRDLDRLTDEMWNSPRRSHASMALDAYRDGDHFTVHLDLPGVDPSSIDLTVERNVLEVAARRAWERSDEQQWVVSERFQGEFRRQLFLGDALDAERIEASYENGVLTITIPVAETAKPRRIEVKGGADQQTAINASSHAA